MKITHILNQDELAELIGESFAALQRRGAVRHAEELAPYAARVIKGYMHLSARYTEWPSHIADGAIDIANPARAPLNAVVDRFGLDPLTQSNLLDAKWAQERGFMLEDFQSERERIIMNELWNRAIHLSKVKALTLAAEAETGVDAA